VQATVTVFTTGSIETGLVVMCYRSFLLLAFLLLALDFGTPLFCSATYAAKAVSAACHMESAYSRSPAKPAGLRPK